MLTSEAILTSPAGRSGQTTLNATHLIKVACETAVGTHPFMEVYGTDYDTPNGTCGRIRERLGWTPKHDNLATMVQTAYDWECCLRDGTAFDEQRQNAPAGGGGAPDATA